jgi:regulator of sigma E protease
MKVEEFGIGIPPKARKLFTDKKGTEYTLNWLPLGGFVRIKWEDPTSKESEAKDAFSSKKWYARVLVLIAWVTMNFLLAWVIFTILLIRGSSPLAVNFITEKNYGSYFLPSMTESLESWYLTHEGIIMEPIEGSIADRAGIASGSLLIMVDGENVTSIDHVIEKVKRWAPLILTFKSEESMKDITLSPEWGKIGSYLRHKDLDIDTEYREDFTPLAAMTAWARETGVLSVMTFDFLISTVKNLIAPRTPEEWELAKEMVAWPIGMWAGMIDMVKLGIAPVTILLMIALLSLNLWVLNILPFPALDGGRLVSTSIISFVGLFTKKKSAIYTAERWIHTIGMILLIGLSLFIAFLDILKL